jgi:hypothetical protein
MWSNLTFGKYAGKSLPQVLLRDPDWFFWAIEEGVFDKYSGLLSEAHDLNYKAHHIKIPKTDPQEWCIRYVIYKGESFADFEIVEAAQPKHYGSWNIVFYDDHLNLSIPRRCRKYDKLGFRLLLKKFKFYFLGNSRARLTRRWCNEFFANPNHFISRREARPVCPARLIAKPPEVSSWETMVAARRREPGQGEVTTGTEKYSTLEGLFTEAAEQSTQPLHSSGPSGKTEGEIGEKEWRTQFGKRDY